MSRRFDAVTLEVLWTRLISVVDEAAKAIVRTSFSTLSNEANDFACMLIDARGYSLAQNTVPVLFFGALDQVIPDRVMAGAGSPLWAVQQTGLRRRVTSR